MFASEAMIFAAAYSLTIFQAAPPPASLDVMFWGAGIVVLPLSLAYTVAVYVIFRGRVDDWDGYDATAIHQALPLEAADPGHAREARVVSGLEASG